MTTTPTWKAPRAPCGERIEQDEESLHRAYCPECREISRLEQVGLGGISNPDDEERT